VQPDIVPDKLDDKINYKIIFLIVAATIFFQVAIYFLDNEDYKDQIIYTISIINPLAVSIAGFVIAKRYRSSKIFGKAYFALACGFLCAGLGEIVYFVFVVAEIETFPSIIDVFFFAMYPLILAHLIICIRFFKPKIKLMEFLWMILIPVTVVSIFITSSFEQTPDADLGFYFTIIYVLEPALVLPLAILGAKTFRGGVIGTAWIILILAIIVLSIGDVWYSYLEIFGSYDLLHPVNLFWYAGYWIVVYALLKHRKSI
jgi:hypothetical protein